MKDKLQYRSVKDKAISGFFQTSSGAKVLRLRSNANVDHFIERKVCVDLSDSSFQKFCLER